MITERGIVETVAGDRAVVRIAQSSSCASCESRAACGMVSDKEIRVEVRNELRAKAGDLVEISMPAPSLFKMGMVVYLFPVLALILGAVAGSLVAARLGLEDNLASIAGGVAALGISFGVLRKLDRSIRHKPAYNPRMTRVLLSGAPPARVGDSK